MRNWWILILLVALPAMGRATQPRSPRSRASRAPELSLSERLLPTPPVIIRFGWTTSGLTDLVAGLRASTRTQVVVAEKPGILEFVCSPDNIIPWGAPLFRVYDLDLLGDLTRAEEFAARIGDQPFVVAPRAFPPPLSSVLRVAPRLPALTAPREVRPALPAEPIVRMPRTRTQPVAPQPVIEPARPASRPPGEPKRAALREASSERLATAEERVADMRALQGPAQSDLKAAQQSVAPLRDDVAARRRLLDAGVIARNDVKAAEERLRDAEAAVSSAQARLTEAAGALRAAEADRDAALAGVEQRRAAPSSPPEPPPTVASRTTPRPALAPAPPPPPSPRAQPRTASPAPPRTPDFPSPLVAGGATTADLPPAPQETIRLARRGDLPDDGAWGPLPWPTGASGALARQRWAEQPAPWQCVVAGALAPQGSIVRKGTPVLELRQTSVARLTTEVAEPYVGLCKVGAAVEVEFPTNGAVYRGWISRVEPTHTPRPPGAAIEILLIQDKAGGRLVYRDLEWMALAAPVAHAARTPLAYEPPRETNPPPMHMAALFPLPCAVERDSTGPPPDGQLSGRLELHSSARPSGFTQSDPVAQQKLERLREWHDSFIEGMKTTVFPESGLTLTYPRDGEVSLAVERIATRRVSHVPNMCARTVAEALGWGLGDAAMWAQRLPERGYKLRADGIARPGDIVVWPFTYGPRQSQHIGLAVGQSGTIMLLSNQEGVLGTQPLNGGYLAFHMPTPKPKPAS